MAEHTPEPWRVEEGTDLIWGDCNPDDTSTYGMGIPIMEGRGFTSWNKKNPLTIEAREANARRIVACVNACAGYDDDFWWEGLAMVAFCAFVPFLGAVL